MLGVPGLVCHKMNLSVGDYDMSTIKHHLATPITFSMS